MLNTYIGNLKAIETSKTIQKMQNCSKHPKQLYPRCQKIIMV